MIRVFDLERSLKFYESALEVKTSHRLDFSDFSLVYLKNSENDVEIELSWNRGRDNGYPQWPITGRRTANHRAKKRVAY
jgi:lactoylglutathione lyase